MSLPAAMAAPTPAKTKRKVRMSSARTARMQPGSAASRWSPNAIFAIVDVLGRVLFSCSTFSSRRRRFFIEERQLIKMQGKQNNKKKDRIF